MDTHTFAHALGKVNRSHDKVSKKSTVLFRPFSALDGALGKLQWADGLDKDHILNKINFFYGRIDILILTHLPIHWARSMGTIRRFPRIPRSWWELFCYPPKQFVRKNYIFGKKEIFWYRRGYPRT